MSGIGEHEGTFLINASLRNRIQFRQINLNETPPNLGEFDVIFLRNVLIYFDVETKKRVVKNPPLNRSLARQGRADDKISALTKMSYHHDSIMVNGSHRCLCKPSTFCGRALCLIFPAVREPR